MSYKKELEELYNDELKQILFELEKSRKKLQLTLPLGGFFVGVPAFFAWVSDFSIEYIPGYLIFILIILFVVGVVLLFKAQIKKEEYKRQYKNKVVTKVLKLIDPKWTYSPTGLISESSYHKSGLFRKSHDRYNGDDLVGGTIEKTSFKSSELHTEYRTSDGDGGSDYHTIFNGLFFHADFNKHFSGTTYVKPDLMESLFGSFGKKFQKYSGKGELVNLENPTFEEYFVVHSSDQNEARYILTPTIMEALVRLRKRYQAEIHLSFVDSRMYCAIAFEEELFEPEIYSSGMSFKNILKIHNMFMVNATIIRELNLNTRIWTKE